MKKQLLLLPFLLSSIFLQAQIIDTVQYVATYKARYLMDTAQKQRKRAEKMVLYLGNNTSKFISRYFERRDSLMTKTLVDNKLPEGGLNMRSYPRSWFGYKIFKNYPAGEITVFDRVVGDRYQYTELISDFGWQLYDETDSVAGFLCQRATCHYSGRKYVAWFTYEIPLSEGPHKFGGLPGFIVKLYDTREHYVFTLESFEKQTELKTIEWPYHVEVENTEKVCKEDFLAIRKNYYKPANLRAELEKSPFTTSQEMIDEAVERLSKQTNFMERIE